MTPYDSMSREQLIDALVDHDATLSEIYNVIHLKNKIMSPGEKLFWIAARNVLPRQKPNDDDLVYLPIDDISEFNGMDDSSNRRYAGGVIDRYDATKELVPYTTKKGQRRDLTYINRSDLAWRSPWTVDLPEEKERPINGNGKRCPNCTTYNLQVKTHRLTYQEVQECECCGYTKISPILTDKDELTPGEYIPAKKGSQAEEPFGEEESEKGSQAEDLFDESREKLENLHTLPVDTLVCNAEELKSLPLWCCHRGKIPYNVAKSVRDFQKAKSNDPTTWTTYDQAQTIYKESQQWKHPFDGIGIMNNGEFVFIDLDHCIVDGQLSQLAKDTIALIDSYTEISQSGTGIHIIAKGTIPKAMKTPELELYPNNRFFVWTGKQLQGTPPTVEDRQEALQSLYKEYAPPAAAPVELSNRLDNCSTSDKEILGKARNGRNGCGEKFKRLYDDGKWDGYPSQSEADQALFEILLYWTDGDVSTSSDLFRSSKLYRPKWKRDDYRESTIAKAYALYMQSQKRKAS